MIKPLLERRSLFWILQISGWLFFWMAHLLSFVTRLGWDNWWFVRYTTSSLGCFTITLLLRQRYRKIDYQARSPASLAFILVMGSLLGANALVWLANILRIPFWGIEATLFGNLTLIAYIRKVFWWIIPFVGWSALYFGIKFWMEWATQKERTEKASALVESAQLQILRYRLNPHFLFNSLNSLRALIGENKAKAKSMITELSEFLRYSLLSKDYPDVPLKNEIDALRHYFYIQEIRYEDNLRVGIDIDPAAEDYPIASFLLHPLAENAVKFGMSTSTMPLKIGIAARIEYGRLELDITNSGKWVPPPDDGEDAELRKGLKYVRQKLAEVFPDQHRFEVAEENGCVRAKLTIYFPSRESL